MHDQLKSLITLPKGLSVGYGKTVIVRVPSEIALPDRGLVLLVGRNGAGKSTVMKYLTNCLEMKPETPLSTAYLPEELSFSDYLSIRALGVAILPPEYRGRLIEVAKHLELDLRKPYGNLSKGNRQKFRLAITIALGTSVNADILVLDEPMSGLDFAIRKLAWEVITQECKSRLVILSLHSESAPISPKAILTVAAGELRESPKLTSSWSEIEAMITGGSQPALPEQVPA